MGPPDSHGIPRDPRYSGYSYATAGFRVRDFHPLRSGFPDGSANLPMCDLGVLQPREGRNLPGLGCSPFARHYLGNHFCFLFLPVLRCFSSRGSPPCLAWMTGRQPAGLPHSEIPGSKVVCTSPRLIAAYHVFRRLPEPRHPPCALSYFRQAGTYQCRISTRPYVPAYTFSFLRNYKSLEFLLIFFISFIEKSVAFSFPVPICQRPIANT